MNPTAHIYGITPLITADPHTGFFHSPQLAFDVLNAAGHKVIQWDVRGERFFNEAPEEPSPAPKETL